MIQTVNKPVVVTLLLMTALVMVVLTSTNLVSAQKQIYGENIPLEPPYHQRYFVSYYNPPPYTFYYSQQQPYYSQQYYSYSRPYSYQFQYARQPYYYPQFESEDQEEPVDG